MLRAGARYLLLRAWNVPCILKGIVPCVHSERLVAEDLLIEIEAIAALD